MHANYALEFVAIDTERSILSVSMFVAVSAIALLSNRKRAKTLQFANSLIR